MVGLILARPRVEEFHDQWRRAALNNRADATDTLTRSLAEHAERLEELRRKLGDGVRKAA